MRIMDIVVYALQLWSTVLNTLTTLDCWHLNINNNKVGKILNNVRDFYQHSLNVRVGI